MDLQRKRPRADAVAEFRTFLEEKGGPDWRTNPEHLPFKFVQSKGANPPTTMLVCVAAIDEAWKIYPEREARICADGKNQIGERTERLVAHLKAGGDLYPSTATTNQESGGMVFVDGRHRFALLRDAGVRCLPIATYDPDSLQPYATTLEKEKANLANESESPPMPLQGRLTKEGSPPAIKQPEIVS